MRYGTFAANLSCRYSLPDRHHRLAAPPRQGQDHEEEHFGRASGHPTEHQARADERYRAEGGRRGLPVAALQELSHAGKKEGTERGANVSGFRHGKMKKAFNRTIEGPSS